MQGFQEEFIQFAIQCEALRFGEFTLKSGRKSPYFFNSGVFNTGVKLAKLGEFYAHAIDDANVQYDMLFGPAYKGIPLVVSTAIALNNQHYLDIPYAFNRKEAKDHGEGGNIVGAPLKGRVLIIDDVITAGTAKREAIEIIKGHQASPSAIVIAIDRQERGLHNLSAVQEIESIYGIPVIRIISLNQIIEYLLKIQQDHSLLPAMMAYRSEFGVE